MVRALENENVLLVSANNQPVKAKTFVEKIYNAGYKMWYEIRKDYRKGDNLNNIHGMATGIKKSFSKSFRIMKVSGDGAFLYMTMLKKKGKFRFVKEAIVLFRSVDNIEDLVVQVTRRLAAKH